MDREIIRLMRKGIRSVLLSWDWMQACLQMLLLEIITMCLIRE